MMDRMVRCTLTLCSPSTFIKLVELPIGGELNERRVVVHEALEIVDTICNHPI